MPVRRDYSLEFLRPTRVRDLVRLGRDHDGGYVVSRRSVQAADVIVGLGINTDWSFEAACLDLNPRAPLVAVDGSVSANRLLRLGIQQMLTSPIFLKRGQVSNAKQAMLAGAKGLSVSTAFRQFFAQPQRIFVNEMISADERTGCLSWSRLREMHANVLGADAKIFLKVDIEGAEYRVLHDVARDASQLTGLVVEFHDCDLMYERLVEIAAEFRDELVVVHVHGNNYAGVSGDTQFPMALEVTFVHRSIIDADQIAVTDQGSYPIDGLDQSNDPRSPDIALIF